MSEEQIINEYRTIMDFLVNKVLKKTSANYIFISISDSSLLVCSWFYYMNEADFCLICGEDTTRKIVQYGFHYEQDGNDMALKAALSLSDISSKKSFANEIKELTEERYPSLEIEVHISSSTAKGGCYIATAIYGSYDCPQVWTLRRYRDYKLEATWYGRAFIKIYYTVSPALIKRFGKTGWFNQFWRDKLDKMVISLQQQGYKNIPYQDKM